MSSSFVDSFLYWIDAGQYPKIERSSLDGSDRKSLTQSGIVKPRAITIDISTNDVYWTDTAVDSIQVEPKHNLDKVTVSNIHMCLDLHITVCFL